jgi:hypothetical protein
MTLQTFIEKAMEGGWEWISIPYTAEQILSDYDFCLEVELLDPSIWQAVGKAERWFIGEICDGYGNCNDDSEWTHKMHAMVQALIDGKTIEQFIETL